MSFCRELPRVGVTENRVSLLNTARCEERDYIIWSGTGVSPAQYNDKLYKIKIQLTEIDYFSHKIKPATALR